MLSMSSPSRLRNRFALIFAAVFAFVSIGLAPAYGVDERLIDVVEVTWAGAAAPAQVTSTTSIKRSSTP